MPVKRQNRALSCDGIDLDFDCVWRLVFLRELSLTGNVSHAAMAAGRNRQQLYVIRKRDQSFAVDWEMALDEYSIRTAIAFGPDTKMLTKKIHAEF